VDRVQLAVGVLGEIAAVPLQPFDGTRSLRDKCFRQLRHILEVSAAHHVQVVKVRRILTHLGGRLNTTLGHHRVGVTVPELGGNDHLGPRLLGQQSSSGSRSPAPDHQYVCLVFNLGEINFLGIDPALGFHQVHPLMGDTVALARANLNLAPPLFLEIRMII